MRFSSAGVIRSKPPEKFGRTVKTRHRVLVADDDTPFARRLSDYLWDHGFECRVTNTISEAKEIVEYWHPDSVFVDLMLPETNALSLCKFIQSKPLKKVPKIIVMSKQTLAQGIETMRRAGAAHYLVKPFSLEDAIRVVHTGQVPVVVAEKPIIGGATIKELHLLNLFLKQAMAGEKDFHTNL